MHQEQARSYEVAPPPDRRESEFVSEGEAAMWSVTVCAVVFSLLVLWGHLWLDRDKRGKEP